MRNLKVVLFNIFCFLILHHSSAQIHWERDYIYDTWTRAYQVLEVPNEGYVAIATTQSFLHDTISGTSTGEIQGFLLKTDFNGDTILSRKIGAGDSIFSGLYGENSVDCFRGGIRLADGNFLIVGETQSYGTESQDDFDLWLLKADNNFDTIWSRYYSVPFNALFINNSMIHEMPNGNVAIVGTQSLQGSAGFRSFLAVFDTAGNNLIYRNLPGTGASVLSGACATSDNGFLCTGYIFHSTVWDDSSPVIIKADSTGQLEWQIALPDSGDNHYAFNVESTTDGNYVFTWASAFQPTIYHEKVWIYHLTKIDLSGNILWTKDLEYTILPRLKVSVLDNDNILLSGWYSDTVTYDYCAYLSLCDSAGNQFWSRRFSYISNHAEYCMDAIPTSDGGFLLGGDSYCCNPNQWLGNTSSLWLVKTDSMGLVTGESNELSLLKNDILISLNPNPANTLLEISVKIPTALKSRMNNSKTQFLIFDMLGKQILEINEFDRSMNNIKINIGQLVDGEYIVVIVSDGINLGAKKFVKNG